MEIPRAELDGPSEERGRSSSDHPVDDYDDFFIGFATFDKCVSFRTQSGTFYIQHLCAEINANPKRFRFHIYLFVYIWSLILCMDCLREGHLIDIEPVAIQ